ncbi:hypothetical protein OC683_02235 ['Crotalaria aegyptiaca' phytoplasma]|uniref:Restriction endonuclease n=1 Tax=Candidatus Phytoplasma crotalariae TaxID=2982627 RepID=A0ABT9D312_9MOLU|nr:hypothetical protein ['Crotalaria aegyptiaca' phytoplasma]MDO8059412.1 hypothetical protein ['Crotalaria aegyptiaca' phytoplasma]
MIKRKKEKYLEIIQLLDQIMTNFESNGHLLKVFHETKFSEDFINSYIADNFKNMGKKTDREVIKGHGKVDILVDSDYIIETKNYYSQEDLEFAYKQLLHRMHHRFLCASIILLVNGFQKNKFKEILENIKKWINLKNGKKPNQKTKFNDNFLIFKIPNPDTGYNILLNIACYHLEFNINHAKKNYEINDENRKKIHNQSRQFIESLNQINSFNFQNKNKIEAYVNSLKKEFVEIIHSCYEYNEYFLKPKKNNN